MTSGLRSRFPPRNGTEADCTPIAKIPVVLVFFEQVTADCYFLSGDGRHNNPDPEMLKMLVAARGEAKYRIWLTYRLPNVEQFFAEDRGESERRYEVIYREESALGLRIDLLD